MLHANKLKEEYRHFNLFLFLSIFFSDINLFLFLSICFLVIQYYFSEVAVTASSLEMNNLLIIRNLS